MSAPTSLAPRAVPLELLRPAPWNPRTIKDDRFQNLCRSIEADPEFLWRRPILAMADGTIYAGNMRFRAVQHLGMETVPALIEDVPESLAKATVRTARPSSSPPLATPTPIWATTPQPFSETSIPVYR